MNKSCKIKRSDLTKNSPEKEFPEKARNDRTEIFYRNRCLRH